MPPKMKASDACEATIQRSVLNHPADIVFIGDSLTAGQHARRRDSTFVHFATSALPLGGRIRVLGRPGARVDDLVAARPPRARVLAVVQVGTNDWLGFRVHGPWVPTDLAAFRESYRRLLTGVVGSGGMRLLCLGVWASAVSHNRFGVASAAYDDAIAKECAEWSATFISLAGVYDQPGCRGPSGVLTPFGASDDVHPNDAGHARIAHVLNEALTQHPTHPAAASRSPAR